MGDVDDATACSVLLADADVLIDYLKSEFAIRSLVAEYVGRVVVLEQVLGEVRGLIAGECERAGIDIIVAETDAGSRLPQSSRTCRSAIAFVSSRVAKSGGSA